MLGTPEPSPTSRVERSASLVKPGSLRPRSATHPEANPSDFRLNTVEGHASWWNPSGDAARARSQTAEDGPQGVAESTGDKFTPFRDVQPTVAQELAAAAPDLTPSVIRGANTPLPAGSPALQRTVQFAAESIPGEILSTPNTPGPGRAATFADGIARGGGPGTGNLGQFTEVARAISGRPSQHGPPPGQVPRSPPRGLPPALSMRRYQSMGLAPQSGRSGLYHFVPIESHKVVADLPLELTLQHSNRIEKVESSDLIPFMPHEKPYFYGSNPMPSTIKAVRGCQEIKKGAFYVQSDVTDAAASGTRDVISGSLNWNPRDRPILVQLYVLFPSLMRPPRWLRRDFVEHKTAAVEVSWHITARHRLFLAIMRQLQRAEGQHLTVWASKKKYAGGQTFTLYGAEGTAQLTDRSYIVLLRFLERREGAAPKSLTLSREGPISRLSGNGTDPCAPSMPLGDVVLNGCGGGGPLGPLDSLLISGASFGRLALHKGLTELQEMQHQLLLRAQSSDISSQKFTLPEHGLVPWDIALERLIIARDGLGLQGLINFHLVTPLLKSQVMVDKIEKVAMANNDASLMLTLYDHTPVEMDLRTLAFLVHAWASQPVSSRAAAVAAARAASAAHLMTTFPGDQDLDDGTDFLDPEHDLAAKIEKFLVFYVIKRRNQLSSTAAILRAIEDEMNTHEDNRRIMRLAYARFHSLHLALLRRLNRYAELRNIRLVERILQPVELPNTVNEVSPLQVASDSRDLKFMTEPLTELYIKVQWVGRELLALTSHEDMRGLGATNPLLAYAVLRNLGFAGKGTMDPLVMAASRLWHLYAFTSTAFFNSPRGRWAVHVLSELVFLVLYQWQVMNPGMHPPDLAVLHAVFLAFIAGNLMDMLQFVHFRYGSMARIRRFLADPWNALNVLVNSVLLVLTTLKLAQDFGSLPSYNSSDGIHMSMATMAVFVWIRALGMAVPVYPTLGPLLNTMARMTEEVVAFLFPMVIIMTGFSTMMTAIYQETVPSYGNFLTSMLQLFSSMLGNFDFTLFQGLPTAQELYGNIAQVVFLVISAILLLNLLIAIVTNRYRPQEVEAETQFKKAQIVAYYNTQVTRNLICSPFSLAYFVIQTVNIPPAGRRNKVNGSARQLTGLGLLPLDGVVLPDDGSDRPTGLAELPHFVYLITLYPILAATAWLLFLLYTPFATVQFAAKQYHHLVKWTRRRQRLKHQRSRKKLKLERQRNAEAAASQQQQAGEEGEQDGEEEGAEEDEESIDRPSPQGPRPAVAPGADDVETAAAAAAVSAERPAPTPGSTAAVAGADATPGATGDTSAPVSRSVSKSLNSSDTLKQYQKLKKALQAEAQQAEVGVWQTILWTAGTMVIGMLGLLVYVVVCLVLVLVGWSSLYQWLAKVVFSVYNIVVRPITDFVKVRNRHQRVSPSSSSLLTTGAAEAAPARGRPGGGGGGGGGSHIALEVASGAAAIAAADGAIPGAHGSGTDSRGKGLLASLRSWRGGNGGARGAATDAAAAAADGGSAAAAAAARERELQRQRQRQRKARLHWQHAIQRVVAQKNERYMTRRDVLKAIANSKFRPHMESWSLTVDPRASSQDILDDQMQDLDDGEDPWEEEEDAGNDDTIEIAILSRTEALQETLRTGISAQATAMSKLMQRLEALQEEVVLLRERDRERERERERKPSREQYDGLEPLDRGSGGYRSPSGGGSGGGAAAAAGRAALATGGSARHLLSAVGREHERELELQARLRARERERDLFSYGGSGSEGAGVRQPGLVARGQLAGGEEESAAGVHLVAQDPDLPEDLRGGLQPPAPPLHRSPSPQPARKGVAVGTSQPPASLPPSRFAQPKTPEAAAPAPPPKAAAAPAGATGSHAAPPPASSTSPVRPPPGRAPAADPHPRSVPSDSEATGPTPGSVPDHQPATTATAAAAAAGDDRAVSEGGAGRKSGGGGNGNGGDASGGDADRMARSSFSRPTLEPIQSVLHEAGSIGGSRRGPSSPAASKPPAAVAAAGTAGGKAAPAAKTSPAVAAAATPATSGAAAATQPPPGEGQASSHSSGGRGEG